MLSESKNHSDYIAHNRYCFTNETSWGCHNWNAIPGANLKTLNNLRICVKHSQFNYDDFAFAKKEEDCPKGTRVCGRDTKGMMCLKRSLECPLNKIIFKVGEDYFESGNDGKHFFKIGGKDKSESGSSETGKKSKENLDVWMNVAKARMDPNRTAKSLKIGKFLWQNISKFTKTEMNSISIFTSNKFPNAVIPVEIKLLPVLPPVSLDFHTSTPSRSFFDIKSSQDKTNFHFIKRSQRKENKQKSNKNKNQNPKNNTKTDSKSKSSKRQTKKRQIRQIRDANQKHEIFFRKEYAEPCLDSLFPLVFAQNDEFEELSQSDTRYSLLGTFGLKEFLKENLILDKDPRSWQVEGTDFDNRDLFLVSRGYLGFSKSCFNFELSSEIGHGGVRIKDNQDIKRVPMEINNFSRKSDVVGFLSDSQAMSNISLFSMKYLGNIL